MAMRVQTEGTNHTKSRRENRDNRMTELLMNFCRCGIAGWCLEVMFTSVDSIMAGDWTLMGQTSLLMFPIYGMGFLFLPLARLLKHQKFWLRGLVYTILIFTTEYITGIWLTRRNLCPWNYSHARWNVHGVIRLDYAPGWFLLGLLYENMLKKRK